MKEFILNFEKKQPVLVVKELTARFDDNVVFENISFEVFKGEVLVIVGTSGCGKSTLLKIMIGLNKPYGGQVLYEGRDIVQAEEKDLNQYRQNIGVLFQSSALFSSMTLRENIELPLQEYTKLDPVMIDWIIKMKLGMVNLEGYENHSPAELSGGMKKERGLPELWHWTPKFFFLMNCPPVWTPSQLWNSMN